MFAISGDNGSFGLGSDKSGTIFNENEENIDNYIVSDSNINYIKNEPIIKQINITNKN